MARWAIFDIDGTLLPGASIESRFLTNFKKLHHIPYRNLIIYFLKAVMDVIRGKGDDAFKSNKMYLKGIPSKNVTEFAGEFFHQNIVPLLLKEGMAAIEAYRSQGYKIMLMSGSLDILVDHLRDVCRPDHIVCSELVIENDRFTGNIQGLHPYSVRKKQILEDLAGPLEIDFQQSIVFANDSTDIYHMELFGEVVAVNPTLELAGTARQKGWKIVKWS